MRGMITELALTLSANALGVLAVFLIVLYQFIEVNAKRAAQAQANALKST